jgi:hypothetical protein
LCALVPAELRDGWLLRVRAFFGLAARPTTPACFPRAGTVGEKALLLPRGFGLRA